MSASDTNVTLSQQPPTASTAVSSTSAREMPSATRLQQSTAPSRSAVPPPAPVPISAAFEAATTTPVPANLAGIEDDTAPPPQRGTFLDLTTEPIAPEEAVTAPSHTAVVGQHGVEAVQDLVGETGGLLQQSDFGFEAGEDTESSGSAVSTPREGAANTFDGLASPTAKPDGLKLSSPDKADAPLASVGNGRFGDRDRGLSMQERLDNLEFSDDEDYDDDDPLGLKTKSK